MTIHTRYRGNRRRTRFVGFRSGKNWSSVYGWGAADGQVADCSILPGARENELNQIDWTILYRGNGAGAGSGAEKEELHLLYTAGSWDEIYFCWRALFDSLLSPLLYLVLLSSRPHVSRRMMQRGSGVRAFQVFSNPLFPTYLNPPNPRFVCFDLFQASRFTD